MTHDFRLRHIDDYHPHSLLLCWRKKRLSKCLDRCIFVSDQNYLLLEETYYKNKAYLILQIFFFVIHIVASNFKYLI